MRFRLTENRIDDLMKRLQNKDLSDHQEDTVDPFEQKIKQDLEKRKRDLEKNIENNCTICLLSLDEAKKIKADIDSGLLKYDILKWPKSNPDWWWLRDQGSNSYYAALVSSECYIGGTYGNITYDHIVRPVLYLKSNILTPYEEYTVYGEQWIAVSEDCLLYSDNKYIEHIFDKKTSVYEDSEIRRYLESGEWLDEIRRV